MDNKSEKKLLKKLNEKFCKNGDIDLVKEIKTYNIIKCAILTGVLIGGISAVAYYSNKHEKETQKNINYPQGCIEKIETDYNLHKK